MNKYIDVLIIFDKDTLVIVMWSSKFRDKLFCLPQQNKDATSDRWMFKSEDMLLDNEIVEKFIDNTKPSQSLFKKFKKKFITEMFNETILDYYTMCYKLYSQFYFRRNVIQYVMCNAFEKQIPKTDYEMKIVPYDVLNKKYYYKPESTMFDELKDNPSKIWEGNVSRSSKDYNNGLHPNYEGYKIIAKKLKEFIDGI